MKVLVTGTAGFIGSHVAMRLLERGDEVIGFDSLSDYYDVELKKARLARFADKPGYTHIHADLADRDAVENAFVTHKPQRVVNLAGRPACVMPPRTRTYTSPAMSPASCTSSKAAVVTTWNTSSSPRPVRSMARIHACPSPNTSRPNTR